MAERLGYALRIVSCRDFHDDAHLQEHLLASGMEDLLLTGLADLHVPELDWSRFTVVVVGSSPHASQFDALVVDTYAQMELALG